MAISERDVASSGSRLRRVLVAVDGSASSRRACELALRMIGGPADVELLTILPSDGETGAGADEWRDHVQATIEAAGGLVWSVRRRGNPAEEIIAEIRDRDPDLVVVGRRGMSGPGRWLGSVSDRVIHAVTSPVLVVS